MQEHSVVTWDPVNQRWIHERGPQMTTPPVPPDIHAIQTYFFDPDEKEWIATVLAPRGRELAAQWHGAYKIPDRVAPQAGPAKKSNPLPLVALLLVLLIVGGGAVVVAGQQNVLPVVPAASASAVAGVDKTVAPAPSSATASPAGATSAPTNAATQAPAQTAARTQPPVRTPVPTAPPPPPPAGTSVTLADGSVVTYAGPAKVNIGESATMTFMVRNGGVAGSGTLLVSYGNSQTGGAKTSSGTLDAFGRLVIQFPGAPLPGNYPIVVNYKGYQGQVAILRIG